ncbi:hypothetical protein KSF78_0006145 [Schistosoma japonicum]|nr:hypothetical protein KSF78_0006145 [Schistosoma japonicum]KAH8871211.1 hypothetical protein KSF78_0006145 [Schistosoma japonicum]
MFDIDAKLLEQFSALGTTDKDELINQLKAVVGNELSNESCRFFLDLADWNLQRAIGAYFDFGFESSPPVDYTVAQLNSLSADGSQVLWLPIGIDGKIPILPIPPSQIVDITLNVTPPNLQLTYLRPVVGALSFCLPNGSRFGG